MGGKWKTAGYIALNKRKNLVIIKIGTPEQARYYIGYIPEVLEVLTQKTAYAKLYRKQT